ncbi:hypothetical protein COCOBI_06-6290 [Coccomyxa sp. Obi]|nr:hypothetical protein COCOBI_06-6290 [Coccomyxa sp. Obi]
MSWAENILVTVSGLSREERNAVKVTLEGAGGRYTPSLSRRCTHLVVSHDADAASSRKLALALHNRAKWRTHIVAPAWITACSEDGTCLPEQDFAAPVLQEHAPGHGLGGQRSSSHAAQSESRAHQQTALPSCSTATAAIHGAAAPQAPSGSPPLAKSRLRRQHSRRLSRFAPGPEAAAQENLTVLQHQRQQPTSGNSGIAASNRAGDKPAAVDASLTVEASGPAFARRPGMAGRIAHPAQQPLQQLPGSSSPYQHPDNALHQVHMHATPPSVMSAPSGALLAAPQHVQPQSRASQWLPIQQQLQPMHQPISSLHQPTSKTASIIAADGSSNSSCGGGLAGAQLAHAVEASARSIHSAGGMLEVRAGTCAEGVPTGVATARTGSGGVSLGGSMGWAANACTDGLAAKLAVLCHNKNSLTSRSTHNTIVSGRDAPAASDPKRTPAQSSTPGSNEALKARLATMAVRQSEHNHSCGAISRHSAGDGKSGAEKSADMTVGRQVSRNAVDTARSYARGESAVMSSRRPVATVVAEEGSSSSSYVRGSSTAGTDARSGAEPQPCANPREHAQREKVIVPDQQNGPQREYAAEENHHAATPSLERGTWQQHEQEVRGKRGVFHGMRAVLDSSLDPSEASRVREAIVAGEGECATGGFLGGSASHVICSPSAASKWLAMGVHVVSAAWVLQSAKSGRQERCLLISADALRGLPLASQSAQETQHSSSDVSADAAARSASTCATGAHEWQALLDQADQRASAMSHQYQTPAALLEDVVWAVTDPPEKARLDSICAGYAEGPEEDQADVVPDSEDEQDKMCAGDWDHAVFGAAAITVLFPADAAGALCHVSRTLRCDAPGTSRRHLLAFVHAFYQERLTAGEISEALQGGLRCSSEVRGGLLAGQGVRRGDLLGSRRNFEGLSRVSRCRNATVYELHLSC